MTTAAVMQPYFFPYLGYFNLIHACDVFVLLDNVQHIARGYVNRNSILLNGKAHAFTVPLANAPRSHWINQRSTADSFGQFQAKFLATLGHAYKNAPNLEQTINMVELVLGSGETNLARLCLASLRAACAGMGLERRMVMASELMDADEADRLQGVDKIIRLATLSKATRYVNSIGGTALYSETDFSPAGLELRFVKPALPPYEQRGSAFVPGLSIIDVLMYVDQEKLGNMVESYELLTEKEAIAVHDA